MGRAVPANLEGLTLVCREPVTSGRETRDDHPITAAGEEIDCLALYDHVEISRDYVFSYRNRNIASIYTTLGRFAFWKIICRLSHRAELFAATAQMIVNALGTDHVPAVRAMVADVIHYAKLIRACVLASVEQAAPTPSGVLISGGQPGDRGTAVRHRAVSEDHAGASRPLRTGAHLPGSGEHLGTERRWRDAGRVPARSRTERTGQETGCSIWSGI